jgi:hypothetical protein
MAPFIGPRWAYGVTTVPKRRELLAETLASLRAAGFAQPRLFVDGQESGDGYRDLRLETTTRWPRVMAYGNWILALGELLIRNPSADRFAIFQDDILAYPRLREYLDVCKFPERGYWNLYTATDNESVIANKPDGWYEAYVLKTGSVYHGKPQQAGRGALALVFNREGVWTLLGSQHMLRRPADPNRGFKLIDGGVVQAMNMAGWREWIHNPSLVQHAGEGRSTIDGTKPKGTAKTWLGNDYDATRLPRRGS